MRVRDRLVIALLRQLVRAAARGPKVSNGKVFGFSDQVYRGHFKRACADLRLPVGYVPHSLRHGGATHDHLTGMGLEDILMRGRWASVKSARHYVQSGRALLLDSKVPADIAVLARQISQDVGQAFQTAVQRFRSIT